jgi:N-acetylglucosamine-6-phosphate deacetylase
VRLGVQAALVGGRLVPGDVEVSDGVVSAVALASGNGHGIAAPGFVDLQVNGFAGVDLIHADRDGYARAGEAMLATGTTAFQPTFITSPEPEILAALRAMPVDGIGPRVLGAHLEGPFISPERLGVHDPESRRDPDLGLLRRLLDAGPVSQMTLAPELPGALELVELLVARGVVVSCGHSDADAAQAHAAYDRGARAITHVHNAHRRWQPRDPGLGGVALVRPEVTVQAIVDGVHLAPESAFGAFLASRGRFCLVTDAIEAAMLDPGEYELGGRPVRLRDGAVRLPDGTLAGSVLTMDDAVRNLVASGAAWIDAVEAASSVPARLIGRDDLGRLAPGQPAHLTVLDDDLHVRRTLVGGREALSASA